MKNLVFIGMRASGKSRIAQLIAKELEKKFYDTDEEISQKYGPVADIVSNEGWDSFRDKESEICAELGKKENIIIATGGGAILRPENAQALKKNGLIIFLRVPLKDLAKRMTRSKNTHRPQLTDKGVIDEIEELWLNRKTSYENNADLIFDAHNLSDNKMADVRSHAKNLLKMLKKKNMI